MKCDKFCYRAVYICLVMDFAQEQSHLYCGVLPKEHSCIGSVQKSFDSLK